MEKRNFLKHLHSAQINRKSLHPRTTVGLGIASLTCLGILFATGLTLFLYYVPEQERAYERILHISTTLRFGGLVRDLHYVSANVLIILTVLHLARVFLTASYKGRRLNWIYGLILFFLVLAANFTGYILPWNQISYWALKVGSTLANYFPLLGEGLRQFILGGSEIGPETLIRTFALHAGIIPLGLLIFTSLHLWRIRKDGGLALPPQFRTEKIAANPWLFRAEGAVALLTMASLFALTFAFQAPIFERANPLHPPNPAKAPWYFIGFQEMVSYSAFWGGVVVPALAALFLVLIPWLDRSRSPGGQWMAGDRKGWIWLFLLFLFSQVVFIVIGQWFRGENWIFQFPF